MTEQELRELIRESIARHAMPPGPSGSLPSAGPFSAATLEIHASHARLMLPRGGDGDGACLIEPAVRCNHCGYCQSYGH